jgi:hypothetical protein
MSVVQHVEKSGGIRFPRLRWRDFFGASQVSLRPDAPWGWPGGEARSIVSQIVRVIPGDPAVAQKLYEERFGQKLTDDELSFAWLRHFAASGKVLHAIYAGDLLQRIAGLNRWPLDGAPSSKALLALVWDGPELLRILSDADRAAYLTIVNRVLRRAYSYRAQKADDAFTRGAALLSATLVFDGLQPLAGHARESFARALDHLILADGSHVSGQIDKLLRTALMAAPIGEAILTAEDGLAATESFSSALERMLQFLTQVRLGDGGLSAVRLTPPHREAMDALMEAAQLNDLEVASAFAAQDAHIAVVRQGELAAVFDADSFHFEAAHGDERLIFVTGNNSARHGTPFGSAAASEDGAIIRHGDDDVDMIYAAPSGLDLRAEWSVAAGDTLTFHPGPALVALPQLPRGATHHVTLERDDGWAWSLTLQGGTIHIDGRAIVLTATGQGPVKWALKRLAL